MAFESKNRTDIGYAGTERGDGADWSLVTIIMRYTEGAQGDLAETWVLCNSV
jgi:hypothetical protein